MHTQRGGRCAIPGDIQGKAGCGSEQPGIVEDVPAHSRVVRLGPARTSEGLFQPKLFYNLMIL